MSAPHYETLTEGRAHFKDLLDAAESGRPASVRRENKQSAIVDAARLRHALTRLCPAEAEMVAEGDGWSIFIPGLPVAADGESPEQALDEMVLALREYADDWQDHLLHAPNHAQRWGLVQLVALSSDQEIKDWLVGQ